MPNMMTTFRIIGESYAQAHIPKHHINLTEENDQLRRDYFDTVCEKLYPHNISRREWANDNLKLFYSNEVDRMRIMYRKQ